jgi:hypothetical protein
VAFAAVVPVLLRPNDWESTSLKNLKPLPEDRVPVTRWTDPDDAWANVTAGLRRLITDWPV